MLLKRCFMLAGLVVTVLMTGCAHPISVTADIAQVKGSGTPLINKAVAYRISAEDLQLEVTTPGGGGDNVSYKPYKDLEPAVYKALSEVFASVSKLDGQNDAAKMNQDRIRLVFAPRITTTSSSSSAFTWPPTDFTVELRCKVTDPTGVTVTELAASGVGKAEFSEFKSDFSLSAKRAAQDAVTKLVKAMEQSPELRK
jgi:hypothetical protein